MDHDYLKYRPLQHGDCVLVLGAFWGDFIREYKDDIINKGVYVINVEPHQYMSIECSKWIHDNMPSNAVCLNLAVFDRCGLNVFSNKDVEGTSSISSVNNQFNRPVESTNAVLTVTLDYLLSMIPVNCVFTDIEGAELEVFENSKLIHDVDYFAIAAYHVRPETGEKTFFRLTKYFKNAKLDEAGGWEMIYGGKHGQNSVDSGRPG
jgi:FkbM family methyltransferase